MPQEPAGNSGWQIVGASVQGVSHQKTDTPCQDCWHTGRSGNVLAAAVADGAGSAQFAREAAQAASQAAVGAVLRFLEEAARSDATIEDRLLDALAEAKQAVEREAGTNDVRKYACTLLLVVAGAEIVAAAQVGDGAVVIGDAAENVFALTKPQTGEHANETIFLVSPGAIEQAEILVWRGKVKNIAVFSDGLQRLALKMPEGTAFAPFFAPLFQFSADMENAADAQTQLESFLKSPRITERADDDLTLLLAHRE